MITLAVVSNPTVKASVSSISPLRFVVDERHVLQGIPSASGITVATTGIYVVGDNSPWIYRINAKAELLARIAIWPDQHVLESGVYPKKIKPDLEAMALFSHNGIDTLLLIGSGSLSPQRDVWAEVQLTEVPVVNVYSLTAFYTELRRHSGLSESELNIEAVEVLGDQLMLFNRGINLVVRYDFAAVRNHVRHAAPCPIPDVFSINLPKVGGIEAGFSGATVLPGTEQVIFTASVENTTNWVDDGAVLGSFIGMFPLSQLQDGLTPPCVMLDDPSLKVESVAITHYDGQGTAHLLLVTDADGGHSELLGGRLNWGMEQ